jgi:hypothetical protein
MNLELPSSHYKEAIQREGDCVCCLIVDSSLSQKHDRLRGEEFVDGFWREAYRLLMDDPNTPIEKLVASLWEPHSARVIAEAMRDPFTGHEKNWLFNFQWYVAEVRRLSVIRQEFLRACDIILEYTEQPV